VHAKSHRFSLLPSHNLLFIHCLLHRTSSYAIMTGETDQASLIARGVLPVGGLDADGLLGVLPPLVLAACS
jgi:hypothetical protein